MNSAQIQYALDRRGYVLLDETSYITTPIQLGHLTGNVVIEGRGEFLLHMNMPGQRAAFEYDYRASNTNDPPRIQFENIDTKNNTDWQSFFRVIQPNTAPETLEVYDVFTSCQGGFAYDCPSSGPMRHIIMEDCSKNSASCMRWKFSGPRQVDFIDLINVRCLGGGRVGPMWDFTYPTNLFAEVMVDEGDPSLDEGMKNNWAGPIAFRIINPCGHCVIDDYWFEPWGDPDVDYPGCHAIEIRVDDVTGNYGQHRFDFYNWSNGAVSYSAGVDPVWFIGGPVDTNAASLVKRWRHHEAYGNQPKVSPSWKIAGKIRVEHYEQVAGTIYETAFPDRLNGISPDSWIRFIYIPGSYRLPRYETDPQGPIYGGTQLFTDYRSQASSPEYDA